MDVRREAARDSVHHHPWRWVVVGGIVGGVAGGIYAAASVRPADDAPVGLPIIVAACSAAGAVAGALND